MKKTFLLLAIPALLAAGCNLFSTGTPSSSSQTPKTEQGRPKAGDKAMITDKDKEGMMQKDISPPARPQTQTPPQAAKQPKTVTITISSSGFQPQEVTIKKGDSVKWINQSGAGAWPASAVHPTHSVYPTTGGCLGSTFDACHGLAQNESWTFKFDVAGSWNYHDHLNPSRTGKVVVQQ